MIVGMVGSLVVMALHPTGGDVVAAAEMGGRDAMARGIHALAIGLQPLLFAGYLGLALSLPHRDTAVLGVVAYGLGTCAVMMAAVLSGLVITPLLEGTVGADDTTRRMLEAQIRLAFSMNQSLTKVFVALAGVAIGCWSVAMRGDARFPALLRVLGIGVAVVGVGGIVTGRIALDIMGFGMVVLVQAAWTCWAAVSLARGGGRDTSAARPATAQG
jgi:hypothetical protein